MKKRGMKKRVLAALMTACMVVGSVPGVSLADATTDNSGTSYTLDGVETTDSAKTAIRGCVCVGCIRIYGMVYG